jgi:hypothetical protein
VVLRRIYGVQYGARPASQSCPCPKQGQIHVAPHADHAPASVVGHAKSFKLNELFRLE